MQPTLKELVEAEEKIDPATEWERKEYVLKRYQGMSESALYRYMKEMESIPEFSDAVIKPGHSTSYIHIEKFNRFLRWKAANLGRAKKLKPEEVI